ncbi:DoxX family protein [Gordonia sp. ABSL11-1]|uniref:DoxX family protein n=1 Tax=Gordonia sp. ABSL11-1 TaxID=3053924 RepID=UPI0025733535|nr:DoxX family protein [Gordonia sp. ABSL11-1]MDL9946370.1 DoxX family protein [Gordonia sp. ABSL11-1]
MVTATATPSTDRSTTATRSVRHIAGVVISVVVGAFLAFDVVGKLTRPEAVIEGTAKLGFPIEQAYVMGTVLLICLVVYAIPRTAVLGALGITAYLGGAVTANMRVESPLISTTLFAVYFGVLMWVGLVLRRPELLKVVGLRR